MGSLLGSATVPPILVDPVLWLILGLVLALPFASRRIERNLELFLLVMGSLAVSVSSRWSLHLLKEALRQPLGISLVVLVVGLLFYLGRHLLDCGFQSLRRLVPLRAVLFLLVVTLGFLSSVFSAIIAALMLVEAIHLLSLGRRQEVRITILACYAIGLGAALTPVGEPLSTITIAKLRADFWFLARLLGAYIAPGVLALGMAAAALDPYGGQGTLYDVARRQRLPDVFWRAARVFLFVAALVLLGTGLTPLVDHYLMRLPAALLFWANTVSAIIDNATLAAAEITPSLSRNQITAILLGLLISGGMLIPGNIPNIIAANRLKIGSREWARFGVPVGLVMLVVYFAVWFALHHKDL